MRTMFYNRFNNFTQSPKTSLIIAILWGWVLFMSIMDCINGGVPSWVCTICALVCCIFYNVEDYFRRK